VNDRHIVGRFNQDHRGESQMAMIDLVGWTGAALVLIAYGLVSLNKKVAARSYLFQLSNLFGALFLLVNTAAKGAYPSTFVNVVWIGIATVTLVKTGPGDHQDEHASNGSDS
jgi:hypothetical protein